MCVCAYDYCSVLFLCQSRWKFIQYFIIWWFIHLECLICIRVVCMRVVVSHFLDFFSLFSCHRLAITTTKNGKLQNVKWWTAEKWEHKHYRVLRCVCKYLLDSRFANAFMMHLFGLNTSEVFFLLLHEIQFCFAAASAAAVLLVSLFVTVFFAPFACYLFTHALCNGCVYCSTKWNM